MNDSLISSRVPSNAKILVTGGTGFIGTALVAVLKAKGAEILVLTRSPEKHHDEDGLAYIDNLDAIDNKQRIDAIVNLAGQGLADQRWNASRKQQFVSSRVDTTRAVVDLVKRLDYKPSCVVSGSAIGYYGPHGDETLTESGEVTPCFSHDLCKQWEAAADPIAEHGIRLCKIRIGVVLGKGGGPFKELRKSFDMGVASQIGDGKHWLSWVHLDDMVHGIIHLLEHESATGVFNFTAPTPVKYADFTAAYRKVKKTIMKVSVPSFMMKMMVGEMAEEVLLTGQRVIPQHLLDTGYVFKYTDVGEGIKSLL